MSQDKVEGPRFKLVFTWGGVVVALLGLTLMATGGFAMGLLLTAAGTIALLFSKRRSREVPQ